MLAVLVAVAIYDVRYRRIPNWLTNLGVLVGFAINGPIGVPERGLLFTLESLAVGFGVYLVLYMLGAMGPGDVKLMAAVGAMVGYQRWFGIFFVTAIVGGIMALLLVTVRGRLTKTLWTSASSSSR